MAAVMGLVKRTPSAALLAARLIRLLLSARLVRRQATRNRV
ncbi:MAG TPA: hypothetical protein VK204_09190 [Nocardioidaceae bacterium]|nr:hypothetical protein [Nocardioidaceae bacterium]